MARPSKMQLRLAGGAAVAATVARLKGEPVLYRRGGWRSGIAENDERIAKLDKALKGKQGRNCNVTACQRPNAWFFNNGTNAYYCFDCAWDIRKFNLRRNSDDGFVLFSQWEEDLARYETEMRLSSAAREAYVDERLRA